MKKITLLLSLLVVAFLIVKLSNTSELKVIEPASWLNDTEYETAVHNLDFLFDTDSNFYNPYDTNRIMEKNFILHKISHILFYSVMTILLFLNIRKIRFKYCITFVSIVAFALLDEIHQFFVVGRSGRLNDVIVDSISSMITLIIIYLFLKRKNPKKKQTSK